MDQKPIANSRQVPSHRHTTTSGAAATKREDFGFHPTFMAKLFTAFHSEPLTSSECTKGTRNGDKFVRRTA